MNKCTACGSEEFKRTDFQFVNCLHCGKQRINPEKGNWPFGLVPRANWCSPPRGNFIKSAEVKGSSQ